MNILNLTWLNRGSIFAVTINYNLKHMFFKWLEEPHYR